MRHELPNLLGAFSEPGAPQGRPVFRRAFRGHQRGPGARLPRLCRTYPVRVIQMHSGLSSTVSVISMVTASSIMGQFAFLRMFADGMASKALRGDFTGQIIMIPAGCSMSLGWGLSGKKKSHPEQLEHSQARVVR